MTYHQLVQTQRDYFLTGEPAKLSHRREQLSKLKKALKEEKDELTAAVFKDLRRHPGLTYVVELTSIIVEIDYVLANLEDWSSTITAEKTFTTMLDTPQIVKEPKGVVLVIGPWNYPLNTLLGPLVNVLAAGNCAIVKPSNDAPHTAEAVGNMLTRIFDHRYVSVFRGGVPETTELLKETFDHIMFTGSVPVGKIILAAASANLTPCTLELGGKCPVIVEPDVDIEITARRLVWGKWLNCGQTCLAPDYVLVNEAIKTELLNAVERVIFDFYGSGEDIQTSADYSRIINHKSFDRISKLLESTTGKLLIDSGQPNRNDLFIPPMVYEIEADDALMQEEIFGPILPIISVANLSQAIDIIRSKDNALAVYVFTRDDSKVQRVINETCSGSVTANDVVIQHSVDTIPFGGIGKSGMGRYHGKFGFDEFTHEKAVLKRGFFGDQFASARYPPINDKKLSQLQALTGNRKAVPRWIKCGLLRMLPLILVGVAIGYFGPRLIRNFTT